MSSAADHRRQLAHHRQRHERADEALGVEALQHEKVWSAITMPVKIAVRSTTGIESTPTRTIWRSELAQVVGRRGVQTSRPAEDLEEPPDLGQEELDRGRAALVNSPPPRDRSPRRHPARRRASRDAAGAGRSGRAFRRGASRRASASSPAPISLLALRGRAASPPRPPRRRCRSRRAAIRSMLTEPATGTRRPRTSASARAVSAPGVAVGVADRHHSRSGSAARPSSARRSPTRRPGRHLAHLDELARAPTSPARGRARRASSRRVDP